jgi:hypothetical protein
MRGIDFTGFTALHMFLTKRDVFVSVMVVWVASVEYMCLVGMPNAVNDLDCRYPVEDIFIIGLVMTVAPIILLLEAVKCHKCGASE